jgi:methylenetetrahydrofolate reductase (NADPH)
MKIIDKLNAGAPAFSFEFFPPKSEDGVERLFQTIAELRPYEPAYVSVTYGAGGSTRNLTVDLVKRIRDEIGIEAMAHLTCVGATAEELGGVLEQLKNAGIENVLPLRGDAPQGAERFEAVPGGFSYASELVSYVRSSHYDFCLAGACYPEGHTEAPDLEVDLDNLKKKVDAGTDFLITQLFFENADYFRFVDRARAAGITVPIIAGIMPITNVAQIKRFTQMCGASIPASLLARLEPHEADQVRVRALGVEHATEQCRRLLEQGVPGVHFYTLNRSLATREVLDNLRGAELLRRGK